MPWWFDTLKVVKVTGYATISPNRSVEVGFSTPEIDRGGYFDPANPNRVTVPGRLGGWHQVLCTIRWMVPEAIGIPLVVDPAQEAVSYFYSFVQLNGVLLGNDARHTANRVTGAKGTWQVMATETSLAAGDELKLVLWHNFDPDYIAQVDARCYLVLRRIWGARLVVPRVAQAAAADDETHRGSNRPERGERSSGSAPG